MLDGRLLAGDRLDLFESLSLSVFTSHLLFVSALSVLTVLVTGGEASFADLVDLGDRCLPFDGELLVVDGELLVVIAVGDIMGVLFMALVEIV